MQAKIDCYEMSENFIRSKHATIMRSSLRFWLQLCHFMDKSGMCIILETNQSRLLLDPG
jgi:hypothetical protein